MNQACPFFYGGLLDIFYIIKQDSHIYMFPVAGQTAEPIGLKFFLDPHSHGGPGGDIG